MTFKVQIVSTDESYVPHFQAVVDSVARERRYLGSIDGFPMEKASKFILDVLGGAGIQYFALDGEKVVGWCDIIRHQFIGCEHVGVLGMGVLEPYRGRGIGGSLLATAIDAAFRFGFSKIELEVFSTNSGAIALYDKSGFVVEGVRKRSRILDGITEDIVCMALFREPNEDVA